MRQEDVSRGQKKQGKKDKKTQEQLQKGNDDKVVEAKLINQRYQRQFEYNWKEIVNLNELSRKLKIALDRLNKVPENETEKEIIEKDKIEMEKIKKMKENLEKAIKVLKCELCSCRRIWAKPPTRTCINKDCITNKWPTIPYDPKNDEKEVPTQYGLLGLYRFYVDIKTDGLETKINYLHLKRVHSFIQRLSHRTMLAIAKYFDDKYDLIIWEDEVKKFLEKNEKELKQLTEGENKKYRM